VLDFLETKPPLDFHYSETKEISLNIISLSKNGLWRIQL